MSYSVATYGHMVADGVRMDAYARAIAGAVKPGSVVVDIGAGPGVFSLLAARAGAKRVHAIEPDSSVWLLKELAAANGFADRIEIHATTSFDVELAERADVIVSDMRGSFPLFQHHLPSLQDAKERLLAPGGTLIPTSDRFFVALVGSEPLWRDLADGWAGLATLGFSVEAVRTSVLNSVYQDTGAPLSASNILSEPRQWATVAYGAPTPSVIDGAVSTRGTRRGTAHALAVWFEATVLPGITFHNGPGQSMVYGRTVLPLPRPVEIGFGDAVEIKLHADARGTRWAWDTEITSSIEGQPAHFRQSTFFGLPTSAEALIRESSRYSPTLSPAGERARRVLEQMNGARTVEELARAVAPSGDAAYARALEEVRDLVKSYGR